MSGAAAARGLRCDARCDARGSATAFWAKAEAFFSARTSNSALERDLARTAPPHPDVFGEAKQPVVSAGVDAQLDVLFAKAPAAKEALDAFCRQLVSDTGNDPDAELLRVHRPGCDDEVLYAYTAAAVKSRARAFAKSEGCASRVVDVVRGSIVCKDISTLDAVLRHLGGADGAAGDAPDRGVVVVFSETHFWKVHTASRDATFIVRLALPRGGSMVAEVQVHLAQVLSFKAEAADFDDFFQSFFSLEVSEKDKSTVLEALASPAALSAGVLQAVAARDGDLLAAFDRFLDTLNSTNLLQIVRECRRDLARAKFGEESPEHALALTKFASLLKRQRKFEAAEPLYKRALEIYESQLGPTHATVAAALGNLADLLFSQQKFDQAEALHRRALEIKEEQLGPDHIKVATSLQNLAALLMAQGRASAAEPLCRRALGIKEAVGHSSTATSMQSLGRALQAQEKHSAAEALFRRALTLREAELGPGHAEVALALSCLASVLHDQQKYSAAEPLYRRDVAITEAQLGPEHFDVAVTLNNLAALLHAQGRHLEAEPLYRRALKISEKHLGKDHPDVAATLSGLALLLQAQGKLGDAEPEYRRALEIDEKQLGPDHPDVAAALHNLAALLKAQRKFDDAAPLLQRALEIEEKNPGNVAAFDVSAVLLKGKFDFVDEEKQGPAAALHSLAELLKRRGRVEAADPLFRRARELREDAAEGRAFL